MKQETPAQNLQPERPSVRYEQNLEYVPDFAGKKMEDEGSTERVEQKSENDSIISELSLATVLPSPVIDSPVVDDVTTYGNNPTMAGDDDLIEKEWVEKAKKIVAETQDNPHQRDEEVNNLQIDYLKKRYGRKLGVTE